MGATDEVDFRASFSNFGPCVDILAPGHEHPVVGRPASDTATDTYQRHLDGQPARRRRRRADPVGQPGLTPAQVRNNLVYAGVNNGARGYVEETTTRLLQVGARTFPNTVTGIKANANSKIVTADNRGANPLIANRAEVGNWERFDIVDAGSGFVALRAKINNRYVTAESAGTKALIANRTAIGTWEKFRIVNNADGSFSLLANANNRYVTAESAGTKALIANRTAIGTWEKFYWSTPITTIGVRANVNGKIVTAENAGKAPLIANRGSVGAWEKFDIVDAGFGYVALRAQVNSRIVAAESRGTRPLIANRTAIGPWEIFYLIHYQNSILMIADINGSWVNAPNAGASQLIANVVVDINEPPPSTFFSYVY